MHTNLDLFRLVLGLILVVQAMAEQDPSQIEVQKGALSPTESYGEVAEAPEIRRLGKHHSSDKSVAGGGVIIGGLVTAIFAAILCYIRVTRRKDADHHIGH